MNTQSVRTRLKWPAFILSTLGSLAAPPAASALHQEAAKWPYGEVKVCWRSDAVSYPGIDFAKRSGIIRQAVENSWGKAANLHFVDWGVCAGPPKASPNGWVVIHWKGQNPGEDKVGSPAWSDYGYRSFTHTAMWYSPTSSPVDLPSHAIHEFGHALGFGHEQDHPKTDGSCWGKPAAGSTPLTQYDARSIMHYCSSTRVPSDWDVVGVQNLYGRKKDGALVGLGNRALDLPGSSTATGIGLQVYNYHGQSNQIWSRGGASGVLRVKVGTTQRCAAVPTGPPVVPAVPLPTDAGTVLQSRVCDGSVGQRFFFEGVQIHGIGNKCLDVPGAKFFTGQTVQIYDCHPGPNQKWTVEPNGRIRAGTSGLCLDVPDGTAMSGKLLQLFPCHDGPAQKFSFGANGEIRFGSLCLDSQDAVPANGMKVQLFSCKYPSSSGKRNQQWYLSGPVRSRGQCLDIRGWTASGSATAQVFPCHGGANQVWDYYAK